MKRFKIFKIISALIFFLFVSCAPSVISALGPSFTVSLTRQTARTAMAQNFSFSTAGYTYTLTAENSSGAVRTVFEDLPYSSLNQSFSLPAGTYTFVMHAYSGNSETFCGTIRDYNLSGFSNALNFVMLVSDGYPESAIVTLEIPDSGVTSVRAGVASVPFAGVDECDYISSQNLTIDTSSSPKTTQFSASNFYSGRRQFVIFYLYDENNHIVATVPESVIITPGLPSSSIIRLGDYELYDALEYSLRVEGSLTKTYYLADDAFNPAGISVYVDGFYSNGGQRATSFEVGQGLYETNLAELVGCDKTLTISYHGLSVQIENAINRSNYHFTEEPTLADFSTWAFPGTSEIPAVFYKFGDYPQSAKDGGVSVSSGTATNGFYIGSDGNYYKERDGSYYKIEPIIWRCLNTKVGDANNYQTIGKAFLFSEYCIEYGKFYEHKNTNRTIDGNTVYSNNWQYSRARAFLNGLNGANYSSEDFTGSGFINTAFTGNARGLIYITRTPNDIDSNSSCAGDVGNRPDADYCGNNTEDKVFLLSMKEVTNPDYGFNSYGDSDDNGRRKYRTDYTDGKAYAVDGFTHWWLRSQYFSNGAWGMGANKGSDARYSKEGGNPTNYDGVDSGDKGIVPALWVSLNGYVDTIKVTGTPNKRYYLAGEDFDPSGLTVTYYDGSGLPSVISSSQYTTNFGNLSGANQTLVISYSGMSVELGTLIHKASYQFTEKPVLVTGVDRNAHTTDGDKAPTSSGTFYKFGDYPQARKDSSVGLSEGTAPNGYYIGTDGNFYTLYGGSYYRIEPIIWNVLKTQGGKALLYSEYCIDSAVPFYYTDSRSANAPIVRRYDGSEKIGYNTRENTPTPFYAYGYSCQVYPNNYEYSTIRAYLNSIDAGSYHCGAGNASDYDFTQTGFLTKAFTDAARKRIVLSTVDNSISSAGYSDSGLSSQGDSEKITRFCPNTQDKVFLLSYTEVSSDSTARKKYRSDYSSSRGVYTKSGYAHYMLRTPVAADKDKQKYYYVKEDGSYGNKESSSKTDKGIVPAIWVELGESFTEDNNLVETTPLLDAESTETTFASNTIRTLNNAVDLYNLVSEGYNNGEYGPIIVTKGYLVERSQAANYLTAGEEIYLITLSGTEMVDGQSTGVWTDLQSGFNGGSDYLTNVCYVITGDRSSFNSTIDERGYGTAAGNGAIRAGLPANSKLVISGHSLGGMISQQTSAQDAVKNGFEVMNVITFGSPLLSEGSREGTLHRLCDRSDIVPLASGSIVSSSDAQWNNRECENGAYGEEIFGTGGLTAHLAGAAGDTRDVTGPHCDSYRRQEVWGNYDVTGEYNGTKIIILDNSTKTFFKNPDLD